MKTRGTEVTIGLPVHTGMNEFRTAVQSIFAQSYQNWKLIIYCDGAEKELVDLANSIDDARVTVIVDSKNRGLPDVLNAIASEAKSEYLARMDADDLMHPDRIKIQMDFLLNNTEIDVLSTESYLVDEELNVIGSYKEPSFPKKPRQFLKNGIICHPSVVMKSDWSRSNPYDSYWIRTEDKELWIRTYSKTKFAKIQDRLMFIRVPKKLNRNKQRITSFYNRKLIRDKGPTVASSLFCFYLIGKSIFKELSFSVLVTFGLSARIQKAKGIQLKKNESLIAQSWVSKIRATEVPGWRT